MDELWQSEQVLAFQRKLRAAIVQAIVALKLPVFEHSFTPTNKADSTNYGAVRAVIEQNYGSIDSFISQTEIQDFLTGAYNAGGQHAATNAGVSASFELKDPVLMQNLKDQSKYLISSVDKTSKDQLARIISGGMDSGLDWKQIAGTIQTKFPEVAQYRSELIARTETANAAGQASLDFYDRNGFKEKAWILGGANICDICQGNADQGYIPIGEAFSSGDDSFPAHPNCQCSLDTKLPDDFDPARSWTGSTPAIPLDTVMVDTDISARAQVQGAIAEDWSKPATVKSHFDYEDYGKLDAPSRNALVTKKFGNQFPNSANIAEAMDWTVQYVPFERLDTWEAVDDAKVAEYVKAFKEGDKFPTLMAMNTSGSQNKFKLLDGAHRIQALKELGAKGLPMLVGDPKGFFPGLDNL